MAVIALAEPKSHTSDAAANSSGAASRASTSPRASTTPSRTPSRSPSRSSSSPAGPSLSLGSTPPSANAAKLPLVVLNNTTTNGLATDAAARFRSAGWTVSDIGNLTDDILSTCAYYDPAVTGAEAAAKELQRQFPAIKRVVERFDGLPSAPVVVVLTPDYSAG